MAIPAKNNSVDLALSAERDAIGASHCMGIGFNPGCLPAIVHPEASCTFSSEGIAVGSLDFVVAHHLLQKVSDPIQALVEWISMLKVGGVLYLTLPNRYVTFDSHRFLTPPSHYLLDYVYRTNAGDYENRGHIAEHLWAWSDADDLEGKSKEEAAGLAYVKMHSDNADAHRHVFNIDTLAFVVETAVRLSGRGGEVALSHDGYATGKEHRFVYRVFGESPTGRDSLQKILNFRNELRRTIDMAVLEGLEGCLVSAVSAPNRGKLSLVQDQKLRWIASPEALYHLGVSQRDAVLFEPSAELSVEPADKIEYTRSMPLTSRLRGLEHKPGLEMSPGASPMLEKAHFNVEYVDKVDHLGPSGTYLEGKPIAVDIILGEQLIDEVLEHARYHYLVSSHVIEHIPDFIQFFKSASQVLVDGGKLLMWVPDKRYTFDLLRAETQVKEIISAHEMKLRHPSRAMVHDFYANVDFSAQTDSVWRGTYLPNPTYPAKDAARIALDADLSKTDVHCFAFTPESMGILLAYVAEIHVPEMHVRSISETQYGSNEFIVEIEFKRVVDSGI